MASPSEAVTTSLGDLAGSFMEFDLESRARGFVGLDVCPAIEVPSASGAFPLIAVEQLLQDPETERGPGSGYNKRQFTYGKGAFVTVEQGLEVPVDSRHAAGLSLAFDEHRVAASLAFDGVLRAAERRTAALIFNATTWTGSKLFLDVTTEWSAIGATARADVKAAIARVKANSGLTPNALIINDAVYQNLLDNTLLLTRMENVGVRDPSDTEINATTLAQALGIERVIIAGAKHASSIEGATMVFANIWSSEYAMICRVATTSDRSEACIGRTLHWDQDGGTIGGTIETYRDEETRGDVVRVRHQVQEKVMYAEAGFLLGNITA